MADTLTVHEAAARLGCSPRTLRRRIAAGEIIAAADPVDRRRRYLTADELRRWLGPRAHVLEGQQAA